jgi:hypothetical protein
MDTCEELTVPVSMDILTLVSLDLPIGREISKITVLPCDLPYLDFCKIKISTEEDLIYSGYLKSTGMTLEFGDSISTEKLVIAIDPSESDRPYGASKYTTDEVGIVVCSRDYQIVGMKDTEEFSSDFTAVWT